MNNQPHIGRFGCVSNVSILFRAAVGRYLCVPWRGHLKTWSDVIYAAPHPTGLLDTRSGFWNTWKRNSANFMLQSSGNLGSCSRLAVAFEGCALLLSAFFPPSNLLIHSSADAIKNSLFFCPFFFANVLAHTHTHTREIGENRRQLTDEYPLLCVVTRAAEIGYDLKANFCGSVVICVPPFFFFL